MLLIVFRNSEFLDYLMDGPMDSTTAHLFGLRGNLNCDLTVILTVMNCEERDLAVKSNKCCLT